MDLFSSFDFSLGYVDPGSGVIILQMLAAGVLGAVVFFRNAIGRVFGVFTGKGKNTKPEATPADRPESKTE